ncbi:MAG: c-type cytochrome domain-containing protein [Chloroflexota bacterium]
MKKQLIIPILAAFLVSAYAILLSGSTNSAAQPEVSFVNDVFPILQNRCSSCHMGEYTSKNLHMDTYESLMAGSQNGPVIVAGNAKDSLLVEKISSGEMPKRGPKLTPAQIQIIGDWINAGAPNN